MADEVIPTHLTTRLLRLPVKSSLAAAHGVTTESFRMLTIIGLHHGNDLSATTGWGECSALNEPGYTHEWAEGAFELFRSGQPFDRTSHPMATAAIEMAMFDAELKRDGQSLADRLGTRGQTATAGGVVGLAPLPAMLDEIETLVDMGYTRVKCKIAPGRIVVPIRAIRSSFPDLELQVDANASLRGDDLAALYELRDLGVRAIEQPFAVDDHQSAARLVADTDMAVVADEAIQEPGDIETLAFDRTATAAAIKPAKLGLTAALTALDRVQTTNMQASIGGMLESGLGRHVLAAFAPLAPFTLTGDLSPARRWLRDDPFRDVSMKRGEILAPDRPGIAGDPTKAGLERHTVRTAIVAADAAVAALSPTNA